MKKLIFKRKYLLLIFVSLIISFVILFFTPLGCKLHGGNWLKYSHYCHSPVCYYFNNCKASKINTQLCLNLKDKKNITLKEIIFTLGHPIKQEGKSEYAFFKSINKADNRDNDGVELLYFQGSPSEKDITVEIQSNQINILSCGIN